MIGVLAVTANTDPAIKAVPTNPAARAVAIEERKKGLYFRQKHGILLCRFDGTDEEHRMESGTGASLPLLLHVVTAGIDHAWNIRNQSRNIRDSYPVRRIVGVVVVIVKGGGSSFQKVFFAAVVVFELNKGVVITEQLLQFFWRGSSTAVGVCAVLCIAILTGVIYSNGKLPIAWIYFVFYGNYLLPL